ncbi:Dual specificity protein kinase YAK1 [Wickerhamomyces ciferrii]|uniref:Dual specificity protein kinase YAK1 n=1 Tax=Wickerhamomyces ciferrii (strain ATCC 14091 / BCRC 22168 / CBS 111 / JCM 3599 / NBRC 0793 / NRRL Y-1031 F-60-10) TaxID=1206466 RepID=K0KHJ6_WICCF|nr:Dual specificity protein kinase YAK1 [Wickerhamomyces ciferrii]CCH44685.1 Dual specificity protein kinase YAK1 [Wickerhamomyces ciferrii]
MSFHYSSQHPTLDERGKYQFDQGPTNQQVEGEMQPPPIPQINQPQPPQNEQLAQQQAYQQSLQPPHVLQQQSSQYQVPQQYVVQQQQYLSPYQQQRQNSFHQQHSSPLGSNYPQSSSEITWNNSYASNQMNMATTPRLSSSSTLNPHQQKQTASPFGSPTNSFKNPWFSSQRSPSQSHFQPPNTNSSSSTNSTNFNSSQIGPTSSTSSLLQHTPTRSSIFNNQLPTTYEDDMGAFNASRKNSLIQNPPIRAPAPPPTYYADSSVQLGFMDPQAQRRQSVATMMQSTPQQQFLTPIQARRQSVLNSNQFPPVKQLPPPQVRKIHSKQDLRPVKNAVPKYRRASMGSNYISPLLSLTNDLTTTYSLCDSDFNYEVSKNPKRVLTKPSEAKTNNGADNEDNDYILYVNDVLGGQENRKYLVLDILGHGTFAQVVKCQNLKTKEMVAVKVVNSKPAFLNQSLSEISILELINRKIDPLDQHHFLRLKDKFLHKNHLCLVFELLSSNLFELIKQNQYKGLNTKLVRNFAKQLLDSLCVLKDSKIIHCDLKPENILLVSPDKPDIKVVDFGSACQERQTLYTYIQSRFYRSPEVILGLPYTTSIDTWSLGCIVAELFLGLPIFPGSSEYDQLVKITSILGLPPTWMIEMGKNSKNFLEKTEDGSGYKMKSLEKYCKERNLNETAGKKYLKSNDLSELIMGYTMQKRTMTSTMIEKETNDRASLVHLLKGLLNLNPLERWTPQQAILHPFIQETKFTGEWNPPGTGLRNLNNRNDKSAEEVNGLKASVGNKWYK